MHEVIGETGRPFVVDRTNPTGRRLREILEVEGFVDGHYQTRLLTTGQDAMSPDRTRTLVLLSIVLVACTAGLLASSGGNTVGEPASTDQQSITGPVAGFIALAAVAVAIGMLIFGPGELNDFARRLMYVVPVAGILLGASQIVALFGSTGASIGVRTSGQGRGVMAEITSSLERTRIHHRRCRAPTCCSAPTASYRQYRPAAAILIFVVLT